MSDLADLHLHAGDLTSKWGFSDGDLVGDWAFDNDAVEIDDVFALDDRLVLVALVREYLMPTLADFDIVLTEISTNHNPIRARSINGAEVDWYDPKDSPLEGREVTVPAADVLRHIHASLAEGTDS